MKLITRRRVISLCVSAMLAFGLAGCASRRRAFHDLRESGSIEAKAPDAGLMVEDEPESGTVLDGSEYGYARISVAASSNASAYIKVLNPDDTLQVEFYVRAGEEGYVDVPQGTYNVHFAQGKTWYGTGDRFGSKTVYGKDDGVELFSYGEGVQYSLTYTTNGNLHLKKLNKNDF